MHNILIVDDEPRMLDLIELFLIPSGFRCSRATSGKEALLILQQERIDLVILDIMMPDMDGWMVCEEIRLFSQVPIIMLTARSETKDVVKGLKIGADDYIIKPFEEQELLARVHALLRRAQSFQEESISLDGFILDLASYTLRYEDQILTLTLKEFHLIKALMSRPQMTFTREQLVETAWSLNQEIDIRTVDSHIRHLRDKLKKAGLPTDAILKTVWGIGYRWS